MLDTHIHPENWGVKPILFTYGNIVIPSYSAMLLLALIVGILVYVIQSKRENKISENAFYIVFAALFFGTLGAKIPIWIGNYELILSNPQNLGLLLSGRTILGGLIGGTLGVYFTKKIFKINIRIGNEIAPSVAVGVAIGRVGCFLQGCCFGMATNLPWGVDFGDGVHRHPTQIYEVIFNLLVFVYLLAIKSKISEQGKLFKIYLNLYFSFRFVIELIRVEKVIFLGLTGYQITCLLALIYINRKLIIKFFHQRGLIK